MAKRSLKKILKRKLSPFLQPLFPVLFFKPEMERDEIDLLKKATKDSKNILEYGVGGSTIHFLNKNKNIYSVDNNLSYLDYFKNIRFVKKGIVTKRLHLLFVDTGETVRWGMPTGEYKEEWFSYATDIWTLVPSDIKIDTVLIDGRFRVLSCLYSLLQTGDDTKFLFHDFFFRPSYAAVLDFLEPVEKASELIVLKKKKIDRDKVEEAIELHKKRKSVW